MQETHVNNAKPQAQAVASGQRGKLSGILVIDKPLRMSSMTAVSIVRRKAGGRHIKVGHAGTLDPLATGVLVVALGPATKLIDRLMATDKIYETAIDLSAFTTTDDLEGERTEVAVASPPTEDRIRAALHQFEGEIMQRPPAFSAMKIDGQRAYKMARQGKSPELKPRPVRVHMIELLGYQWPGVQVRIKCAKGFYVRSFARDLGEALGTGGHCTMIRREAVGPFTLALARPMDALPAKIRGQDVMSIEDAMRLLAQSATEAAP